MFNENIKERFLEESNIIENTKRNYRYILEKASKTEKALVPNKDIYEMTPYECDQLILSYPRKSELVIAVIIACLKKYVDFCKSINLVEDGFNYFSQISGIEDMRKYLDNTAIENKYVNFDELVEIEELLMNEQDAVILELLFVGLKPEEIIDLEVSNVSENKITLENREVEISDRTYNMIQDAINQQFYYRSNGEAKSKIKEFQINSTPYVIRAAGSTKFDKFQYNSFQMRFKRIKEYSGNYYLTPTNVIVSGQIHVAKQIKVEKGKLEKEDYQKINELFGMDASYWYQTKTRLERFV